MARVTITEVRGGPGLKSTEVGPDCGLHINLAANHTLFDFSGGASTENAFVATRACTLQRALLVVNEAIAAAATLNVGKINGTTTTATHFVNAYASAATVAAGTIVEMTLANTAIAAGDTVTVNSAGGSGGAGTGWVVLEYTIDDENN